MAETSASELRAERVRVLGEEFGSLFHALWNHVVELHGELQEFRKLYGSRETFAVLNETAGPLFRMIRKVLWEHVLLYVARLTDKTETGLHPNLTLWRLPLLIDDAALKQHVDTLLTEAAPKWEPVRTLRNKWLAHLDLHVWTDDPRAAPLPDMNYESIEDALSSMRDVLSKIEERHFGPADRRYFPHRPLGNADDLVFWLRRSVEADAELRERALAGHPLRRRSDSI